MKPTHYEDHGRGEEVKSGILQVTLINGIVLYIQLSPFYPAKPKLRRVYLSEEFERWNCCQVFKN